MHTKMNHFPFSFFTAKNDDGLILCDRLHTALPHGSGINPPWNIEYKNNFLYASNDFESMNENGYYCHTLDFTAIYQYNGLNASEDCEVCKGKGKRWITELALIRNEHPMHTVEFLVIDLKENVIWNESGNVDSAWFSCSYCNGSGKRPLPEFQLIRINFHGNKEHNCCQYGLKDYLYDVLRID